ncbi:Bifunctional solanapyrone synthase 3 [Colletotrichum chlorophyti]|uniref:Bifunctional solanapyrone synthase 3 n=1 Tax=Colletotrichum chlorophyti TaxID=708187 RepID=A0A1Q8S495_9PEZI|nr:Bifunctional solanapyrone synthase 3 [Colletotrichum chlorophyti]
MKTISSLNCTFGVRGGGHGSFAGSNSVDDGVTGGRAGTVGVGGFITGGSNSFHSASHSMACEQVATFEVVLAGGSIVNANATSNFDLWQGLKGSGANLGLVTRFDMYAIDLPDPKNPVVWGGNLIYDLSSGPQVIDALVDFAENVHKDENSSSIVYWAYIPAIGEGITQDTTKVDLMSVVANELGSGQPSGFCNAWFTLAFANDARFMNYAVEKFCILNNDLEAASIVDKGISNGGNIMGLDHYISKGTGIMFLITLAINGVEEEAIAFPLVKAYVEDVDTYAASLNLAWDWKYLNYAHKVQDVIATFGDAAIEKLKAASAEYDPTGVFQTLRHSGFKIPS